MDYAKGVTFALLAAVTAALVGIFARIGMKEIPPLLATAMRSVVMMVFCVVVATAAGMSGQVHTLHRKAILMIVLSGVAGAMSWIFGFYAYDLIGVSKTSPIDKLSVPLAVILAVIFLQERPSAVNWVGVGLICAGAYCAALKS
jgi:bacterial/archaeal transporter family protein